jgi:7,8-dihydropterin-6-yl-methyl-4-(beta-D-ribofuranosyl)aminobenzene 5'-phosphate synthase
MEMNNRQSIRLTIVYDNNTLDEKLDPGWGFSCFIKGLEKSILFDTGGNGKILLSNMEKLEIPAEAVDLVILSHAHQDHTGGLDELLRKNPKIEVWVPEFFSKSFKETVKKKGTSLVEVENFQKICEKAYTTGVIQGWIKEQSLALDTDKGLVVMTGCAHPRIVNIIAVAKELLEKDIYLVLGGFHLVGFAKNDIMEIIDTFRAQGVKKVGPCHCSGEEARQLFAEEYKDDFIDIGAGKEIEIP